MRLFEAENRPLYYKRSPSAWRNKCMTLTCEQEGFLNRVVEFMWDVGMCVPDGVDGATAFRMNVLKFRKLAADLVASGHLTRGQGHIFNVRALREIEEWNEARIKRARAAVEREFQKLQRRKSASSDSMESDPGRNQVGIESVPGRNGVGHESDPGRNWVDAKKPNENNAARPDVCENLHIERKEKEKEKEKEKKEKNHSLTPPYPPPGAGNEGGDEIGPDERTLHPALAFAIGQLAILFGSETDPDTDQATRVANYWAAAYSPDDVRSAVVDFVAAGRDGRRNGRLTEGVFGRWVKQAYQDRTRLDAKPVIAPKRIPPGPIAEGFTMGEDGRVSLANGKRAEWLDRFAGDEALLDLTLIQLSAKVKANSPTPVVAQIESALATASRDIVVRRKNTLAAVEARDAKHSYVPLSPDGKLETEQERTLRELKEAIGEQ